MVKNKEVPQNLNIEKAVIGACILETGAIHEVVNILKPEMFYDERHIYLFRTMIIMVQKNIKIDRLTIMEELRKQQIDIKVTYIDELCHGVGSSANILQHALIIAEKYLSREIIKICENSKEDAFVQDPFTVMDFIIQSINELDDFQQFNNSKSSVIDCIEEILKKKNNEILKYFHSNFKQFDKLVQTNLRRIILVCSGNKHGKTKFITQYLFGLLHKTDNVSVNWHTYEVDNKAIIYSYISRHMQLSEMQLQSIDYTLSDRQIREIRGLKDKISNFDIEFTTTPQTIDQICSNFRKFCAKRKGRNNILIVDNKGLIESQKNTQNEQDDDISKKLTKLRDQTGGLIIILHHLKKEYLEKALPEEGFRPMVEHIKGSTSMVDYANQVWLLNNTSMHNKLVDIEKSRRPDMKDEIGHYIERLFIVDVQRNRHGPAFVFRFMQYMNINDFKEWR